MAEKVRYTKDCKYVGVHHSLPRLEAFNPVDKTLEGERYAVYEFSVPIYAALRAHGAPIKSPINFRYDWSGPYTPFQHQRNVAAFFTFYKKCFNFSDLGTGKTHSALWAADFLLKEKIINRVLVVSPLSTLEPVWDEAVFAHFPHLRWMLLHGLSGAQIEKKLPEVQKQQLLIANHEMPRGSLRKFFLPGKALAPDLIIVDEGSLFRNGQTSKWKGLRNIVAGAARVWWMTATPTPNSPTDAWAQAALVGTNRGMRFTEFRDLTMRQATAYIWAPRPGADMQVKKILQPSIRYEASQCIDLPGITYQMRQVAMTKEQIAAYKIMHDDAVLELKSGVISAMNEAIKAQKLLQLACGVLYTDEGGTAEVEPTHKLQVLQEIMEETTSPVIVFAPFKSVVRYLAEKMKEYDPVTVMGETAAHARASIVRDFQEGKTRLLIAHPGTMAHGLTLTASSVLVWYAPVYSNDTYTQANGRIYRQGQEKHCSIIHLASSDIEREIYTRLKNRQRVQGAILTLLAGA